MQIKVIPVKGNSALIKRLKANGWHEACRSIRNGVMQVELIR